MNSIELKKILEKECKYNQISLKIVKEQNFPFHLNINEIYIIYSSKNNFFVNSIQVGHWYCLDTINTNFFSKKFSINFFDSYGKNPSKELCSIFNENLKKYRSGNIFINKFQFQLKKSFICGHLCCLWLFLRLKKISPFFIQNYIFSKKNTYFNYNLVKKLSLIKFFFPNNFFMDNLFEFEGLKINDGEKKVGKKKCENKKKETKKKQQMVGKFASPLRTAPDISGEKKVIHKRIKKKKECETTKKEKISMKRYKSRNKTLSDHSLEKVLDILFAILKR